MNLILLRIMFFITVVTAFITGVHAYGVFENLHTNSVATTDHRRMRVTITRPIVRSKTITPPIQISFSKKAKSDYSQMQLPQSTSFIDEINRFRITHGKSLLSEDTQTCTYASNRASQIAHNFSHDGFGNGDYPSYTSIGENIAIAANDPVVLWIGSPQHREILLGDFTFGCVRNNGIYYVFEGWKP